MISYPIDWSRPWSVLFDNPLLEKLVVRAHTKTIHTSDGEFGDTIMVGMPYQSVRLSKENKAKARYAIRTGNKDLLKTVYASEISQHSPKNSG